MTAWWVLFKKEFLLMRMFWIINAFILVVAGVAAVYTASRYHSGIPSFALFLLMVWHSIYLVFYMLVSLRLERGNAPTWLQSPQPGWSLLSAKFVAGLVLMLGSLLVNFLIWNWVLQLDFGGAHSVQPFGFLAPIFNVIRAHWLLGAVSLTKRALCVATAAILVYFVVDLMKYSLKGWRWIIGVLLYLFIICVSASFMHSGLFQTLFGWGKVNLPSVSAQISFHHHHGPPVSRMFEGFVSGYWGGVLYEFLVSLILFLVTAWLFDRKVEV